MNFTATYEEGLFQSGPEWRINHPVDIAVTWEKKIGLEAVSR